MKFKPMTPEQVTRGVCMRRCAWGKRVQQLADESGVSARALHDVIVGKPFSEAVRSRLEGYLRTPAGPSALRQDNNPQAQSRFAAIPSVTAHLSCALACPAIQAAGLRSRSVEIVQRWRAAELFL